MGEITFEEIQKRQLQRDRSVTIDGDQLVIDVAYKYEIELSRCNTPEKILSWAYHLTSKIWMNTDLIAKFIEVAAKQIGWNPDLPEGSAR